MQLFNAAFRIPFQHVQGYDWTKYIESVFSSFWIAVFILMINWLKKIKKELPPEEFNKKRKQSTLWGFGLSLIVFFADLTFEFFFYNQPINWTKGIIGAFVFSIIFTVLMLLFSNSLVRKKEINLD